MKRIFAALLVVSLAMNVYGADRSKYYRHDALEKANTDSTLFTFSGADTAATETLETLGWPYRSLEWHASQANDSIAITCSLYVSVGDTFYGVGSDVNGSKNYAAISITAPGPGLKQIAMPLARRYFYKFFSGAGTGTGASFRAWWLHAPQGE